MGKNSWLGKLKNEFDSISCSCFDWPAVKNGVTLAHKRVSIKLTLSLLD